MNEKSVIPNHIAIIMDGNRRWAREHGLPAIAGHQKVANEMLEPLVEHAYNKGVKILTFWAFSTENWRRDPQEVTGIMNIFLEAIEKFGLRMHKKGIQIRYIGNLEKFNRDIQKSILDLVELTKNNSRITVVFALNYGGRDELIRAFQSFHNNMSKNPCDYDDVKNILPQHLDTCNIPDPDLIVRTGGEERLSGFLLWQSEYSELYFPKWYMPEFTPEKLDEVLVEYKRRQRRFGK
jgi:undecaprenyl diphosphate synthase